MLAHATPRQHLLASARVGSSARDNLRELRAMQNKDKIYAPEELTLHGALFCLMFYSATARHEQDTKCLRMASRNTTTVATEMEQSGIEGLVVSPRKDIPFGVFFCQKSLT